MANAKICKINGIEVDLDAICSLSHECRSEMCRIDDCCCSKYDIIVDDCEIQRIVDWIPPAAKYAAGLTVGGEPVNIFSEFDSRSCLIDTTEEEICIFAWEEPASGAVFCSLHSAAAELGVEPYTIKPADCVRWPLALESNKLLTIVYDALDFPCNEEKDPADRTICPSLEKIIVNLYGPKFLQKLHAALK